MPTKLFLIELCLGVYQLFSFFLTMIHLRLFLVATILAFPSCSSDEFVGLPQKISTFIENYYPNYGVENHSKTKFGYWVKLKSGPGITFNTDLAWTDINGYGQTLSQFLLFDQLPPAIYEYLQETENLENVYAVARDTSNYFVSLFDSLLTYRIANAQISVAYG